MLRNLRVLGSRTTVQSLRNRSSAALAEDVDIADSNSDGYGNDYGAGPSRIPYQDSRRGGTKAPQTMSQPHADILHSHRFYSPASSLLSAQKIRSNLAALQHGDFVNLSIVSRKITRDGPGCADTESQSRSKRKARPLSRPLSALSRLELHIVIHHLLRVNQPLLASAIMSETAKVGIATKPKRRRLFASRTLETLFRELKASPFARESQSRQGWRRRLSEMKTTFNSNQRAVVAAPTSLTTESQTLLELLDSLQEIRHRRPKAMYEILVRQCIHEGRPDIAAKVYVGLVEEWVTEGRVAEGADIDDFCEGGGPSEKLEIQLVSDQMATWWQGVRTWRMPGEVLSPHGRLDLWHPKNLSLGEKMKGFPMPVPTSPPTVVPAPETYLLLEIIESLRLDPHKSSLQEHTASMRALAYLANTVLSRTLPVSSLRGLFQAMSVTVHRPAVYPESIDPEQIPQSDRWAYESFTQIHLALQSLLSAPPMSANSIKYAESVERARENSPSAVPHPPPAPSGYMLPPLAWSSCLVLLRYGMSRLRMPNVVRQLTVYMKQVFGSGHTNPKAHNIMLEAATHLRDKDMARMVSRPLFGDLIGENTLRKDTTNEGETTASAELITIGDGFQLDHPDAKLKPLANERSLTALITHLTATSRLEDLEKLVYALVPYLAHSKSASVYSNATEPRPDVNNLPLSLYPVILSGLRKAGRTGLAQRVFKLALRAEADLIALQPASESRPGKPAAPAPRLHIDTFTNIIEVYANEARRTRPGKEYVKGWAVEDDAVMSKRDVTHVSRRSNSAAAMAWRTYGFARSRWRNATSETDRTRCAPDLAFFTAITRACSQRWALQDPDLLPPDLHRQLLTVYKDMEDFEIPVFGRIARKLGMEAETLRTKQPRRRADDDPAIALAETWLGDEDAANKGRITSL
jgi:hypothetical protein